MYKLNPFISIKMDSKYGFVLVDHLNKKNFELNKDLLSAISDEKNFKKLKNTNLLLDSAETKKFYKASRFWTDYHSFDALLYHTFCYRYPFLDYEDGLAFKVDIERMGEYEALEKMPSFFKVYNTKQFKLPKPNKLPSIKTSFLMEMNTNKSVDFSIKEKLNILLYTSFSNTTSPGIETHITRPVPSGGAKHPIETYIIFPKDSLYPEGVYHYNVRDHALEQLYTKDVWKDFLDSTYNIYKGDYKNSFAFVYTAKLERAMYRYRDIRSTRAIFIDEGHIVQNAKLVARALGWDYISEYKSREDKLKDILMLQGNIEPIISTQLFYEN